MPLQRPTRIFPLVLIALLSCGRSEGEPGAKGANDEPKAPTSVRLFEVGKPVRGAEVQAAGTVQMRRETPLSFWTAGIVARLDPRPGDRVRAGALLAMLDTRTLDSDVAAARADLARARAERERQQKLLAQGWVARARVDAAEAAEGAARAALERALFAQRNARIVAPADGVILERRAEPGQTVAAGDPVLILGEDRSGHVLRVPLAPRDMVGLSAGMPARVVFADGVAPEMAGRIIEVGGKADPRTGTFMVEIALPAHPALRSGLVGRAVIPRAETGSSTRPLAVPATALFAARAGEGFVWKLDPATGRVKATRVRLGPIGPDGVAVEEGLAPGDRIVRSGVDRLTEGEQVRVVTGTPA